MNIIATHVKESYVRKKHNFKKFNRYSTIEIGKTDEVWYKMIVDMLEDIFSTLNTKRVNVKIVEQKYWAEALLEKIFQLRVVPHPVNLLGEKPYYTYVELNVDGLDRIEFGDLLKYGLFLHQAIRKHEHKMFVVEDMDLLRDEEILYMVQKENWKTCRKLNKVPKMPRVFEKRDRDGKLVKLVFA